VAGAWTFERKGFWTFRIKYSKELLATIPIFKLDSMVLISTLAILFLVLLVEIWVFKVSAGLAGYDATWGRAFEQFIFFVMASVAISLVLSLVGLGIGSVLPAGWT